MDKAQLKEERRRLHKIYVEHDVEAFREFLKDRAEKYPSVKSFLEAPKQELSELMHSMKSQLLYLGEDWQNSRNHLRYKQFWEASERPVEEIPLCITCKFFREGPKEGEDPCMHLGATPADISCTAYEALK